MKEKIALFGVLAAMVIVLFSCNGKSNAEKEIITKKIMYDVSIVNEDLKTDEDFKRDWFWLNIPDVDLDKLITKLFDDVKDGKVKSYKYDLTGDYETFEVIPEDQLKNNFEKEWYVFDYVNVKVDSTGNVGEPGKIPLKREYIKELRFLEEWYFEGDEFCKRVIAVAPIFVYEVPGQSKGINILYWVYMKDLKK
jgi:hypothetical protein